MSKKKLTIAGMIEDIKKNGKRVKEIHIPKQGMNDYIMAYTYSAIYLFAIIDPQERSAHVIRISSIRNQLTQGFKNPVGYLGIGQVSHTFEENQDIIIGKGRTSSVSVLMLLERGSKKPS